MSLSVVAYIVGIVMEIEAGLMLLPALVGLIYGEASGLSFLAVAAATAVLGIFPILKKPENMALYAKGGFVATALSWIVLSAVGALPFYLTGQIPNYLDALFEMVSGFTTTGASTLQRVEVLDHCMIFWRSFSLWIGGMGVLVLMLAILPMAGGQNLHLMRAESPGPTVGKLVPRLRESAIWLYGIYIGMTILCFALLWAGGMKVFDAVCLTLGTAGTGGFRVVSSGYAEYSMFCKWVTTVFMVLFGMNFNFYYLLILRKFKEALRMEEIRWYLLLFAFAALTILLNLYHTGLLGTEAQTVDAFFAASSIITTTGFTTVDFNLWPAYSKTILVMLMFIGACAGSTCGGMKISRWIICCKTLSRELRRMVHPRSVRHIQIDGKTIDNSVLQNTFAYLAVYVLIYAVSLLVISLDGLDLTTNFTAVVAVLNNIGLGLERLGPTGSFDCFSVPSKLVMIFDMLAGRLEIYPMMILFLPTTWKRHT